ncbi:hypothetical protein SALWKB29_2126 [Snodgrassella communis]|uniref:Uncharacterized protein n=1 Tax=Snodgrassella communis TaxID=2946699 RepID=A0A836MPK8_9NEIS|nr:hypothetical protein SALWKB29_2126 [Snodgrassella communis]
MPELSFYSLNSMYIASISNKARLFLLYYPLQFILLTIAV